MVGLTRRKKSSSIFQPSRLEGLTVYRPNTFEAASAVIWSTLFLCAQICYTYGRTVAFYRREKTMSETSILYHGSKTIVESPEIRIPKYNKDFYFGFYCTLLPEQAIRWATRFDGVGYLNTYRFTPDPALRIKRFPEMTEEWLDFIVACRLGRAHDYDIVEGPMANDTIFNYVQNFVDGKISREAFWALARFKHPTHQISFHTARALATLTFLQAKEVRDEK